MANIQQPEFDNNPREPENPIDHGENQGARNPNDDRLHVSPTFLVRLFTWLLSILILITNLTAFLDYRELYNFNKCVTWDDWNHYLFTGAASFLFLLGYHNSFLFAFNLEKTIRINKGISQNVLIKLSFAGPIVAFLLLSDYINTIFSCDNDFKKRKIVDDVLGAFSMILIVVLSFFLISPMYFLWNQSKNGVFKSYFRKRQLDKVFKDCLIELSHSKGIDKFKKFVNLLEDDEHNIQPIRLLLWKYSFKLLSDSIHQKDLKKNSQLHCSICLEGFQPMAKYMVSESKNELIVCHPTCLYRSLQADATFSMNPKRFCSLLDSTVAQGSKFDLGMLKTI